jgi:hypothetical protein
LARKIEINGDPLGIEGILYRFSLLSAIKVLLYLKEQPFDCIRSPAMS